MSDPAQTTYYGVKGAAVADLVDMVRHDSGLARDELRSRLAPQLLDLFKLYIVAYGPDNASSALTDDLASLKIPV